MITVTFYFLVFHTHDMQINSMRFRDYDLCMKVVQHIHEGRDWDPKQCYAEKRKIRIPANRKDFYHKKNSSETSSEPLFVSTFTSEYGLHLRNLSGNTLINHTTGH